MSSKSTWLILLVVSTGPLDPDHDASFSSGFTPTSVSDTGSATVTGSVTVTANVTSMGACASVSELIASFTSASPSARPTVPAEIAYECINSVPFNASAAYSLMESLRPYINWQTTIEYLKDPPIEYAEKVQPPYDFWANFAVIEANVTAGAYANEYDFGWHLYRLFQYSHDGHSVFVPDSVGFIFTYGRTVPLVSVSLDGVSLPAPYAYADILTASFGNATFTPSAISMIDGQNATEYLLNWSEYGSLQDRDALWNNVFYILAQVSLGSSGTGAGTFSGGGRGRFVYPGPTTTLTFANGTSTTYKNFARVLVPFDGITTGEDIYRTYFIPPASEPKDALELAIMNTSSTSSTIPATITSTPAPGYPSPIVRQPNNLNSGYFLDGEGYDDVAVLSVPSFVGLGSAEITFQQTNEKLIAAALAAGKTKLIIDVSANGGGTVLQGYDLFKQLFPAILPYGASRFRAHEAFNLVGEAFSEISAGLPRSLSLNETLQSIVSSAFDYRTDANITYQPFTSWTEKYGPHEYGPANDTFTSIIRWNLSDPLTPDNSGGVYVHGYGPLSNYTQQPFARENIIVLYDGYCASTCTIFSELMRQQAGVKTIALGGRPNHDIIQAVGGVKGTNDFPYNYILELVELVFQFSNESRREYYNSTVLGTYSDLPLWRSSSGPVVNSRDGIRQGDGTETPLQFVYEPADCRIFYTPEMVVDETAVWKTVADTVWNGKSACVAGSNNFYGTASKRSIGGGWKKRGSLKKRTADIDELWKGMEVETDISDLAGDGIMLP
ncbi:hypothetical protein LTR50_004591 [Elasticomyces elasticus]|nr:hypothetical protein LTR50_004591 [Elasticomyces elasticus]